MNLAIVGTGNVGSGVLAHISPDTWDAVAVIGRNPNHVRAAIMDAVSADYRLSPKLYVGTLEQISEADVIVHAAGVPIPSGNTAYDTFHANATLIEDFFGGVSFKSTAVLILVASPVDHITRLACRDSGLSCERILGFGGDLDTNRLRTILARRNLESGMGQIVGEHGQRSIPVFPEGREWEAVCEELHNYFPSIVAAAGHARNVASSVLLARLAHNIATGAVADHTVCVWHDKYNVCLTWPHEFRHGVWTPSALELGPMAHQAVEKLVFDVREEL